MLSSIPRPPGIRFIYNAYIALFFVYLAAPLIVVAIFAFNDSLFPSLPWKGFTLAWFFNDIEPKLGLFHDSRILAGFGNSFTVAVFVTILSIFTGTSTAFLFERYEFRFKSFFYMLMLAPLVIPGVILGISILVFSSAIASGVDTSTGYEPSFLRPGLPLVVLGQFSFIATISTLVIAARLRKFDRSLEEAALNLGATPTVALLTIILPYLRPAMLGSAIVSFLISFENFNTTLILNGSNAPLTVTMFDRMREGSTPVLNAVSLTLMIGSGLLGLIGVLAQRDRTSS
jgi:spermidine/putrescine transport system permease protein